MPCQLRRFHHVLGDPELAFETSMTQHDSCGQSQLACSYPFIYHPFRPRPGPLELSHPNRVVPEILLSGRMIFDVAICKRRQERSRLPHALHERDVLADPV